MHDFVAHIDWRTKGFQRALDNFDRAIDTGAKTTRIGEQDLHGRHYGRVPARAAKKLKAINSTAPTLTPESATLKAGNDQLP